MLFSWENMFDSIKLIDEMGNEYWLVRELFKIIEYTDWRNFKKVLDRSKIACKNSNYSIIEHFVEFNRVLEVGNNAKMEIIDYKLSRYACYLIAQNGDSRNSYCFETAY